MPRVVGIRAFWVLWAAMLLSFTGSGLTRFGLSVWVYQETRDALAFASLLFFAVVPLAIGALVAGTVVDRLDRRTVLVWANLLASVPTVWVLVLFLNEGLTLPHLWAALFVNGVANAFVLSALDASVRMLVPVEALPRASGLVQTIQTTGLIVAPPMAGLVMVELGLAGVFAIDLLSVGVAVAAIATIVVPRPERTLVAGPTSPWRDFVIGLAYVAARPPFMVLMLLTTVATFAGAMTYAASGPLVLGFVDERAMGLTYAVYASGNVLAALAIGATGGPRRRMLGVIVAALVMAFGSVVAGSRPSLVVLSVGVFAIGVGQSVLLSLQRAIFQIHALPEVLGRVFSLRLLLGAGAQAAGLLSTGWVAARLFEPALAPGGRWADTVGALVGVGEGRGTGALLVLAGVVLALLAGLAWSVPAVREVEERLAAMRESGVPPRRTSRE